MNSLLIQNLDEIEAAAKEATPGPWEKEPEHGLNPESSWEFGPEEYVIGRTFSGPDSFKDARFIALCDPATILTLTAALRTAIAGVGYVEGLGVKKWTVYLPVIHSEVYGNVEANSAREAISRVLSGESSDHEDLGEHITGKETEGCRAVEEKPKKRSRKCTT